jgi:aryl-alcohol dehydrogenase-like predicted oxidoreductase
VGHVAVIPATDLDVFALCLGGNVFGRLDRDASFPVLDAYVDAGGNFIDTADLYGSTASEEIIGDWIQSRDNRDSIVLATKVGMLASRPGLSATNIRAAAEDSLRRLRTDRIDLYYAHQDDEDVPVEEVLGAFGELIEAGKVRHIACSNFGPARLAHALAVAEREGLPRYTVAQEHYNLVERAEYENGLRDIVEANGMACAPYFALAQGFLTGKYRPGAEVDSVRAGRAGAYLDERGKRVLAALDEVASAHECSVAAVALAWLAAQPTVLSPIASATSPDQLKDLVSMATLTLSGDELALLASASE